MHTRLKYMNNIYDPYSCVQVANAGDDVLIFYNDHAFSTLLRLMKEDRDDAVSLTGRSKVK